MKGYTYSKRRQALSIEYAPLDLLRVKCEHIVRLAVPFVSNISGARIAEESPLSNRMRQIRRGINARGGRSGLAPQVKP